MSFSDALKKQAKKARDNRTFQKSLKRAGKQEGGGKATGVVGGAVAGAALGGPAGAALGALAGFAVGAYSDSKD